MNLTKDQRQELVKFPAALQALVTAELAVGNSIVELGHTFPAPPVGAYIKLAKFVSVRPRASGDGLVFFERSSSSYSGEFTDAKRFYFVLEPAKPPPIPDMAAIQKAAQNKDDDLNRLAQREPQATGLAAAFKRLSKQIMRTKSISERQSQTEVALQSSTPTSNSWLLHFRDTQSPHEIQAILERELMTLFSARMEAGKLTYHAQAKMNGAPYVFLLTYEAASFRKNCYSLRVEVSWADSPAANHDYFRKSSASWFGLWTRDFQPAEPVSDTGSPDSYQKECEAALSAEAHLDSVAALQNAIVAALRRGASFSTAHKEGGTNISWRGGSFVRSDYGESESYEKFASEGDFLKFLRQFYDWQTSQHVYPNKVSDLDAWKLIRRLLRNP